MAVLGVAGARDLAGRDLQRRVQARRAVALVVVGHPRGLAGLHRQRRLGAIERLDLGLLVDAEHQRALRRSQVEPDDIDDLLGQLRVLGELKRADLMRLELVLAPDPMHRRRRDPGRRRQPTHAPMRAAVRRRLQRHRQHPLHLVIVDRARATGARRVGQTLQTPLTETAPPQARRSAATPRPPRRSGCSSRPRPRAARSGRAAPAAAKPTDDAATPATRAPPRSESSIAAAARAMPTTVPLVPFLIQGTNGTLR